MRDLSLISRHGCVHCNAEPGEGHLFGCTAPHLAGLAGYPAKESIRAEEMVSAAEVMADYENRWIEYLFGLRETPPGGEPLTNPCNEIPWPEGWVEEAAKGVVPTQRDIWRHTHVSGRPSATIHSVLYSDSHHEQIGDAEEIKKDMDALSNPMILIDECALGDMVVYDIESDGLGYAKFTDNPDVIIIGGKEFPIKSLKLTVAEHAQMMTHWVSKIDSGQFDITGTITTHFEDAALYHSFFESERLHAEGYADLLRRYAPEMVKLHYIHLTEPNNRAARRRAGRRERKKDWKSNAPHHP
jgi:hypothetical protein